MRRPLTTKKSEEIQNQTNYENSNSHSCYYYASLNASNGEGN